MKVELTDISQGVSVSDPTQNVNRLHFKTDTGRTFSVPIAQEHMEGLLRELFGEASEKTAEAEEQEEVEEREPPMDPDATVFGEGGDEDIPRQPLEMTDEEEDAPRSEEDIPSL